MCVAFAGRKTSGRVQGQIWVDGHVKNQATFARVSGYVEQVLSSRHALSQLFVMRNSLYRLMPAEYAA